MEGEGGIEGRAKLVPVGSSFTILPSAFGVRKSRREEKKASAEVDTESWASAVIKLPQKGGWGGGGEGGEDRRRNSWSLPFVQSYQSNWWHSLRELTSRRSKDAIESMISKMTFAEYGSL